MSQKIGMPHNLEAFDERKPKQDNEKSANITYTWSRRTQLNKRLLFDIYIFLINIVNIIKVSNKR